MFQSAPPARGATSKACAWSIASSFNPRPPREGRPQVGATCNCKVSIRAPRGGATPARDGCPDGFIVSIRAPRARGDACRASDPPPFWFQSAPPREGRRRSMRALRVEVFQSAPPREGRRYNGPEGSHWICFNPRPRARGDRSPTGRLRPRCFNPRPPREGRPSGRRRRRQ